jgi:prepilin-type N-terminal cleavage/methylation domain-containing protein
MLKNLFKNKSENGFSLVEIMVALGLVGGIAMIVMNLGKQGSDIQRTSMVNQDEIESLKIGPSREPMTFKKEEVDGTDKDEGFETALYQVAADNSVAMILSSDPDSPTSRFGRIKIKSIKLLMNNGTGFNYPQNTLHYDEGIIRITYEKTLGGDKFLTKIEDLGLSVSMSTNASGLTTAISCAKDSAFIRRTPVTVTNMVASGYQNWWDADVDYSCPGNKVMCGELNYNNDYHEDRRHAFRCCDMLKDGQPLVRSTCSWSGQVNLYDGPLDYTCPGNSMMTGHISHHENGFEDRVYSFQCCEYKSGTAKIVLEECQTLPEKEYHNNWGDKVDFTCPAGKVKVGENSFHHGWHEDRMYRFRCCKVVVEEIR